MTLRMARLCLASSPRGGLLANVLWLVFALSFLWFPYFGMWVFPCQQQREHKHHSNSWSKYGPTSQLVDYTTIGELKGKACMDKRCNYRTYSPNADSLSTQNHSIPVIVQVKHTLVQLL